MKNININIVLIIIIILQLWGCDAKNTKLKITNASKSDVYFYFSSDSVYDSEYFHYYAKPGDTIKPSLTSPSNNAWQYYVNSSIDSAMWIFCLKEKNNNLHIRLKFKVKDLDSMNWIVTIKDS